MTKRKRTCQEYRKRQREMPVPLLDIVMNQLLKEHVGNLPELCMGYLVKRTPMMTYMMYDSMARKLHHNHVLVVQLVQLLPH